MNQLFDQEVVVDFISEAKGYLPEILQGIEQFAATPQYRSVLKEAHRFAHIIKGAASMLGFNEISNLSYQLEVTLELLHEGSLDLTDQTVENICQMVEDLSEKLDHEMTLNEAEQNLIKPLSNENSSLSLAHSTLSDLTPAVIPDVPLVSFSPLPEPELPSANDETEFRISLPADHSIPTVGDLDLGNVVADIKENYGDAPVMELSEIELPSNLMDEILEVSESSSEPLTFDSYADDLADELLNEPAEPMSVLVTPPQDIRETAFDLMEEAQPGEASQTPLPQEEPEFLCDFENTSEPADPENFLLSELALTPLPLLAEETLAEETVSDEILPAESNEVSLLQIDSPETIQFVAEDQMPPLLPESFDHVDEPVESLQSEMPEILELTEPLVSNEIDALETTPDLPDFYEEALLQSEAEIISEDSDPLELSTPQLPYEAEAAPEFSPELPAYYAEALLQTEPATKPEVDEISAELMEVFLLEAEEHLLSMHSSLRQLEANPVHPEMIQNVRRSAHSLKGTAAMIGFEQITHLAHRMEDLLDLVYDGELTLTPEMIRLLTVSTDLLEDMSNHQESAASLAQIYQDFEKILPAAASSQVAQVREEAGDQYDTSNVPMVSPYFEETELPEMPTFENEPETLSFAEPEFEANEIATDELADVVGLPEMELPEVELPKVQPEPETSFQLESESLREANIKPEETPVVTAVSARTETMTQTSSQFVRVPIEKLDEVVKLISEMIIARTTFEQRLGDFAHQVEEMQLSGTRLRRVASNLETKYEASTLGGNKVVTTSKLPGQEMKALRHNALLNAVTHGFDDLEFDRYTEFHLLSRELSEASNDIQTLGRELSHLNSDFLGYLNRQGRIYSELQHKLMRLRMIPLASVAPRLHRTVRTVSTQREKDVRLVIDGENTAIDTTALQDMIDPLLHLLRNAVDHGIETPEERQAAGKAERGTIHLRAFYEGSQVIMQLSDDGKGLDIEKIRATAIRHGYINASEAASMTNDELWSYIFVPGFSTAGQVSEISGRGVGMDIVQNAVKRLKGTITIDSQVGRGTTFTVRLPLTLAVTRTLMVKANDQTFAIPLDIVTQIMRLDKTKMDRVGQEPVLRHGGKVYPLLLLSRLLNLKNTVEEVDDRLPVIFLNIEGKKVAVIVNQLIGGREIVIKTLGNHLRKVHGVMGATLMGDGEVVLILNPGELLRGTLHKTSKRIAPPPAVSVAQPSPITLHAEASMPSSIIDVEEKKVPAETVVKAPEIPTVRPPRNARTTIMVVDDSPSVRRVNSNLVKSMGWEPVQAKDGLDALEKLQAGENPDLIMLDIEMPRMDGYQLLSSLRALPAYRHLPVVMISSRSSEKHRQKAFDLGATEYLVKPYQEDQVINLINHLLQEAKQ